MKLVIVVDMQNDFLDFPPDGDKVSKLPIPDSADLVPKINQYLYSLDPQDTYAVVFTKDWHSAEYVETLGDITFPSHCVKDTWGAELAVNYELVPADIRVLRLHKNVFNMFAEPGRQIFDVDREGWYDRDEFFLDKFKEGMTVEIVGVAADVCVRDAVKGFLDRGFDVTVYRNLTKGLFKEVDQINAEYWEGRCKIMDYIL